MASIDLKRNYHHFRQGKTRVIGIEEMRQALVAAGVDHETNIDDLVSVFVYPQNLVISELKTDQMSAILAGKATTTSNPWPGWNDLEMCLYGFYMKDWPQTYTGDLNTTRNLTAELEAFGKQGHSLSGEIASMEKGGQIKVISAKYNGEDQRATAVVRSYATIVPLCLNDFWPRDLNMPEEKAEKIAFEKYKEYSGEVEALISGLAYHKEWDQDFVDIFMQDQTVSVNIACDQPTDKWQQDVCNALSGEISKRCGDFQNAMADLATAIDPPIHEIDQNKEESFSPA